MIATRPASTRVTTLSVLLTQQASRRFGSSSSSSALTMTTTFSRCRLAAPSRRHWTSTTTTKTPSSRHAGGAARSTIASSSSSSLITARQAAAAAASSTTTGGRFTALTCGAVATTIMIASAVAVVDHSSNNNPNHHHRTLAEQQQQAGSSSSSSSSSGAGEAEAGGGESNDGNNNDNLWSRMMNYFSSSSTNKSTTDDEKPNKDDDDDDDNNAQASDSSSSKDSSSSNNNNNHVDEGNNRSASGGPGPGQRVKVPLEPELVESLPLMSLEEVIQCDGLSSSSSGNDQKNRLLVTYDGIVYDVSLFVKDHPGGYDLIETAAGYDLEHFFANYTVHGQTDKAALWLAPCAVGRLSPDEADQARARTTPQAHVDKRMKLLRRKRRRILVVASTLPFWITVRTIVRWIGAIVPPLGRFMANALPVSVPGYSKGAEPLRMDAAEQQENQQQKPYTVAVIGGGIAGCGAAWALSQSGFQVTLYEARENLGGNARTFDWDFSLFRPSSSRLGGEKMVKSCVSVTAWPPIFYKNYTCLLEKLGIETVHQPLSWFINSKVPGYEGTLWEADPTAYDGSLRKVFESDFRKYKNVVDFAQFVTNAFTLKWAPWRWNDSLSMYDSHQGFGLLNPMNVVPLYSLFKIVGGSDEWWNIIFTPQYTASFLVDELRPFPAVFGPLIEQQIPLNPNASNSWQGKSKRSDSDCNITTCVTWKDAGKGIRKVFEMLVKDVDLKKNTRIREIQVLDNGKKRVYDEYDNYIDVDRVVFACPANAVGNMYKKAGKLANAIFSTPVYADDHHPSTGHMHAIMHSDPNVIPPEFRDECLKRASNYVEVTQLSDGTLNIENQYNFGVQTPGPGIYDLPLDQKPVMLIGHALGEDKSYDPTLIRGQGNHARAHPLYSGWNVAAQLCLRLVQGQNGIYYCSNWTTPGNCHDMSLLSGLICAHAIGAKYPFDDNTEAKKDFARLRDLMGI